MFKPKHIYKKKKHSVAYSGRLPNFQVSRDCIDLLGSVMCNFKSRCKSKVFYYAGLFYYIAVFNNSWCALQCCTILRSASHLVSLTCYNLILCLSHAGRTGFREADTVVTTILCRADRDPCRRVAARLDPLPYPCLPSDQKCIYCTRWMLVSLLTCWTWAWLCDKVNVSVSTWQMLIWALNSKLRAPPSTPSRLDMQLFRCNFAISGTRVQSYIKVVSEESLGTTVAGNGCWSHEPCYPGGLGMTSTPRNPHLRFV